MDHTDFMKLAITMAANCKPKDPTTPRVGAVIVVDGAVVALASRGENDHAEKIAMDVAIERGADLKKAIVYTTLEPCVASVRRKKLDSCADRLVASHVRKVVVGMHDPNISVCGKGFLRLQEGGIETELFPFEFAQQVSQINRDFILSHQRVEAKITHPKTGDRLPTEPGST